jgi:hypothetical protein
MKKLIILSALVLSIGYVNAQHAFTNRGNLQIHTGATVSVFGNFTNTASAQLVNQGSLYAKRNITNDQSSMPGTTGSLILNGSVGQTLDGTQPFMTANLTTDNSNGVLLNTNLIVSSVHTYSNGLITTSATPNYLVYEAGSSHTGSNDSRHVNGWVKKIGSTDFTFPVGNAIYLRTIGIANLSSAAEFNCNYRSNTQNIYNLAAPLVQVDAQEYWQLDRISGGTAKIALNWDNTKVPFHNVLVSDVRGAYYSTGTWINAGGTAAGNISTTGSITTNAMNSFGSISFGFTAYPVPVRIISFTAERNHGTTYLKWTSENEQMVDRYEVQRSNDPSQFASIGSVPARNLAMWQYYSYDDRFELKGVAYYRLKIIDNDGKVSYSRVVAVSESVGGASGIFVQNPVRSAITIFNRTGKQGKFDYKLTSMAGQEILKGNTIMSINGGMVIPVPPQTSAGAYILEIIGQEIIFREKLFIGK